MAHYRHPSAKRTPVFGIAGWAGSGKTTMIEKLTRHFAERGLRVATVKHTHHKFDVDKSDSDTSRHRAAGASETAIVSGTRVAVIEEIDSRGEPSLQDIVDRLKPADVILVEGYKSEPIPKIEVRRAEVASERMLSASDPLVLGIAADYTIEGHGKPVFDINNIDAIAGLIEETCGPFKTVRLHA